MDQGKGRGDAAVSCRLPGFDARSPRSGAWGGAGHRVRVGGVRRRAGGGDVNMRQHHLSEYDDRHEDYQLAGEERGDEFVDEPAPRDRRLTTALVAVGAM